MRQQRYTRKRNSDHGQGWQCVARTIVDIYIGRISGLVIFGTTVSYHSFNDALNVVESTLRAPKSPSSYFQSGWRVVGRWKQGSLVIAHDLWPSYCNCLLFDVEIQSCNDSGNSTGLCRIWWWYEATWEIFWSSRAGYAIYVLHEWRIIYLTCKQQLGKAGKRFSTLLRRCASKAANAIYVWHKLC